MNNFAIGNNTISGNGKINDAAKFVKAKDYVGTYEGPKYIFVLGFIKTHSDTYNKDQYSLYCQDMNTNEYLLMNVPEWYGKKLSEDFFKNVPSKMTCDQYFDNVVIKKIETFRTKFNTDSVNIIVDTICK